MKLNGVMFSLIALLCTAGCAKENRAIIPPDDTKWVYVEIKVPQNTRAVPLSAFYTSDECKKVKYNSDMKEYKKEGTYVDYIKLEQDKNSGNYKGRIPIDGGGQCKWKLGELTIGIEYSQVGHLIKNAKIGTAIGIVFSFDNIEREIGFYRSIGTNVSLSPTYYPIIKEQHLINEGTYLSLFGKESFELYKINSNGKGNVMINFHPVLDESKVVRMIGPKEWKPGNHWRIEYPDGTVTSNGDTTPSFDKLNAM